MIAGIPYDAEIEYLEQESTYQYISTGIVPPSGCILKCVFQFTDLSQTNALNILGTGYNAFGFGISGGAFQVCSADYYAVQNNVDNGWHEWFVNDTTQQGGFDNISVRMILRHNPLPDEWKASGGFPLFRRVRSTNKGYDLPVSKGRCKSIYLGIPGTALFDGIAVRVGQVGYMYDRVTRKLFGNAGTGAFVLGPDVATPVMGLRRYPQLRLGKMGARHMIYGGN